MKRHIVIIPFLVRVLATVFGNGDFTHHQVEFDFIK